MPDVIIIGGGLTGLSAAFELEKLGIAYTLIEVKGRLGSNIVSDGLSCWTAALPLPQLVPHGDEPFS